ncbi:unnamed protein product [Cunninghamella echinulata]
MYSNPIVQAATTKEDIDKSTCEKTSANGKTTERVPVGTVRLITVSDKIAKLGRLAVLSDCRGMYLGRQLVKTLIKDAANRGMVDVVIHSQYERRGFYEKLGFVIEKGDEETFLEDDAPHIRMWLRNIHEKID